jgi:hypothetical protein
MVANIPRFRRTLLRRAGRVGLAWFGSFWTAAAIEAKNTPKKRKRKQKPEPKPPIDEVVISVSLARRLARPMPPRMCGMRCRT